MLTQLRFLINLTHAHKIFRRYFVTNGFDGALTTLGLIVGFYSAQHVAVSVVVSACMGTAIALAVSGFASAYISEAAEREKELKELEQSLIKDMEGTAQSRAAQVVPIIVAAVNGLSPFSLSMLIILPLLLGKAGYEFWLSPLETSIVIAFCVIFLLGAFLGKISGGFWLWSSLRTVIIAAITATIILWLEH